MKPTLLLLMATATLSIGRANAQETKRALVLPTQLGGFIPNRKEVQKALDILVENRLRRARVQVLPQTVLSRDEALCSAEACLEEIANAHAVDVVVASHFINDEQRNLNAYHISVRLFVRGEKQPHRHWEKDCAYCSDDKATDLLALTVAEALAGEPTSKPAAPATTPIAVHETRPVAPTESSPQRSLKKPILRGAAIAASVVGVIGLSLGGWKAAQNGEVSCGPECRRRDTTGEQATFFTIGVVAIAAAIPMAIIGWKSDHAPERKVTLLPSGAGMRLQLDY
jgi:hypothetical protein